MLNQVVLVGEVEMVSGSAMLVNVDEEKIAVQVWEGLEDKLNEFIGKMVGVKGKISKGGVLAERVSVLSINDEGKEDVN